MADDKKHVYNESKVKTLSSLEHIRLCIGCIDDGSHHDDGWYILLREVLVCSKSGFFALLPFLFLLN